MGVKEYKKCNLTIRFSKYVIMLSFLMGVIAIGYNQICNQTLFLV